MIHPDTRIGAVHLTVSDLQRSLDFYQQIIGFSLLEQQDDQAWLTVGQQPLLVLHENRSTRYYPNRTGLYHFAILVPSRLDLAQSLSRIAETKTSVQGFADHHVSEAIYLPDPDGNGIEIYRDRPRDEWTFEGASIKMATDPLDLESLMNELGSSPPPWNGLASGTTIGHMHLHVASIESAENFYHNNLGFEIMLRYGPSASFLSAGGYHHHIGINTWNGIGASAPPEDASGLRWFEIVLPNREELQKTINKLHDHTLEQQEPGWLIHDPASNPLLLTYDQ